jgi:3'(2'), 5'-bisphosphate nucleotidase
MMHWRCEDGGMLLRNMPGSVCLPEVLPIVRLLAMEAGRAIMKVYETDFSVGPKSDKSLLTIADPDATEVIVSALRKDFPNCAILAEESRDDHRRLENDHCFIVDPLDGTKEFVNRNGQFTVNIALAYKHKAVLGVICVPTAEQLYYAYEGGGAFFEDIRQNIKRSIHVSSRTDDLVAVGSRSHALPQEAELFKKHQKKISRTLSVGSSLKGCMVAAGEADIYYRFGLTSEWDTAAMQCIVEEAGGIFRQMNGAPMRYNRKDILNRLGFYVLNRSENIWI